MNSSTTRSGVDSGRIVNTEALSRPKLSRTRDGQADEIGGPIVHGQCQSTSCERNVLLVTTYSRNHVTDNTDQQLFDWCMVRPGSPFRSGRV
ncbi:hypothetical protein pipiens_008115 [Culex pipiens pipiens]|uniref:Uncharacterized protein n=1 Tax=Culex pipiens pipiens TaxID=38569 RepID=A0ABD1DIL9_CULPP